MNFSTSSASQRGRASAVSRAGHRTGSPLAGGSSGPDTPPETPEPLEPPPLHHLFRRRVVIVSGKGGVGKSTVTAALARLAARQGKKVLVVELAGQCNMAMLLGGELAGYQEVERQPGLFTLSVTPEQSMEEYLTREMHSKKLYQLIFRNRYVGPFLAAVPGLEDLVSIGKVMDLERSRDKSGKHTWDLILVDAPATGQGLNLLRVPKAMMEMTRVGPFYSNTRLIHELITDPHRTALNLVTLPEEMPVNETIEMFRLVHRELHLPMGYCIVNHLRPQRFTAEETALLPELLGGHPSGPVASPPANGTPNALQALLTTVTELNRRAMLERSYLGRLEQEVHLPLLELPALTTRNIGPQEVEALAQHLSTAISARELPGGVA